MKEIIYLSFLIVVVVAFVVGYLTGKDAAKHHRRRTPHAPDACPVCGGSGSYDTLETVEPCPLCKNGQAQVM